MNWVERAPIWLIGLAVLAGLILAHELGSRFARRSYGKDQRSETATGYLVTSALALLGLLMAFTFSAAQDRFRLRQELVVAEANAIGTTYLRFQLLDEPWRGELSRQMLAYTEVRERFARARTPADIEANARQTAGLQDSIWGTLDGALRANSIPTINLGLLQTVNESFDLAASRRAAREARIPITVLRSLLFCAFTVAAIVGSVAAPERRYTALLAGILLLLTLAFCLILDLDRPNAGSVRIAQAPMENALASIRQAEAAKHR